jgi:hypothetical protein
MAHGFPPPFCTGKKFLQDENGKKLLFFLFFFLFLFSTNQMAKVLHH